MAAQAAVVGDHLWLVGGWNPAAAAVPGADPQSQFLNDVWRLDLRTGTWQEVTPQGEAMPRISRWAAVARGFRRVPAGSESSYSQPCVRGARAWLGAGRRAAMDAAAGPYLRAGCELLPWVCAGRHAGFLGRIGVGTTVATQCLCCARWHRAVSLAADTQVQPPPGLPNALDFQRGTTSCLHLSKWQTMQTPQF